MRVFEGFQFGQEGPDYGAEYGGEQWKKEQAAVAPVTSTDWMKTVMTAVSTVGKTALETAAAVKAAQAKVKAAKAAVKAAAAPVTRLGPTVTTTTYGEAPTNPLLYVGIAAGGVAVLGLLAYLVLS